MKKSFTEELCTECGLCCDGTLLDDVELKGAKETLRLEIMGLNIDLDDRPSMILPCSALKGTRCSVYTHRPTTCRRFECKLLQRTQRGEVSVDQAKAVISKTLKQAASIRTTCAEIEGGKHQGSLREMYQFVFEHQDPAKDPQEVLYSKLSQEMDVMNGLIYQHFLDDV